MPKLETEIAIDRPADEVWAVLGNLADVSWVPGIVSARVDGPRRICMLEQGGEIHEEIDVSDERRCYRYVQPVHPLGLERSAGSLAVEQRAAGACVVWAAEVEFADEQQEAQVLPMLREGYAAALQLLKRKLESE